MALRRSPQRPIVFAAAALPAALVLAGCQPGPREHWFTSRATVLHPDPGSGQLSRIDTPAEPPPPVLATVPEPTSPDEP